MSKQLHLSINNPCHENWNSMPASGKGKFCGACQKQVIDFSAMSDSQLIAFFKKPPEGDLCGRFTDEQLDRGIDIPKKRIPWVKYFFQLTLPLFLASLKTTAQKIRPELRIQDSLYKNRPGIFMGMVAQKTPTKQTIRGYIVDEDGKRIPFASVMIKGTQLGMAADSNGVFNLTLNDLQRRAELTVSSVGFEGVEKKITSWKLDEELCVVLKRQVMEEVVVTATSSSIRMGGFMHSMRISYEKENQQPLTALPALQIYPNPVTPGASIHIQLDKKEESYYSFQLITSSGQVTYHRDIWIDKDAGLLNIAVPSVAAGAYIVRLVSRKSGKMFAGKLIIVQ